MTEKRDNQFEDKDLGEGTPEERRLEVLLAELPRYHCPSRIRESVVAELRGSATAESATPEPAATTKVVDVWLRRRAARILQVAAALVVAVVGFQVYQEIGPHMDIAKSPPPVATAPLAVGSAGGDDESDGAADEPALPGLKAPADKSDVLDDKSAGVKESGGDYFFEAADSAKDLEKLPERGERVSRPLTGDRFSADGGRSTPAQRVPAPKPTARPASKSSLAVAPTLAPKADPVRLKPPEAVAAQSSRSKKETDEEQVKQLKALSADIDRRGQIEQFGEETGAAGQRSRTTRLEKTAPPAERPALDKLVLAETETEEGSVRGREHTPTEDSLQKAPGAASRRAVSSLTAPKVRQSKKDVSKEHDVEAAALGVRESISGPGSIVRADLDLNQKQGVGFSFVDDAPTTPAVTLRRRGAAGEQILGIASAFDVNGTAELDDYSPEATRDLDWLEVESAPAIQQKIIARNTIGEILPQEGRPAGLTRAAGEETTWPVFVANGVVSFNLLVNNFDGWVNGSQEVVVNPGERQAIVVECVVPIGNNDALINTVNQKRMVALYRGGQAREAKSKATAQREAWNKAPAEPAVRRMTENEARKRLNLTQVSESELAESQPSAFANFFVQQSTDEKARVLIGQLQSREARRQQNIRAGSRAVQVAKGRQRFDAGYGIAMQDRTTSAFQTTGKPQDVRFGITTGVAQAAGRQLSPLPPGANYLYFVLEPDRLPVQIGPPVAARALMH